MTNNQSLGINQSYDTNIEYLSKVQSDDDLYTLSKANEEFNNLKFLHKYNSLDINVDNELSLTTSIHKQNMEYKKHHPNGLFQNTLLFREVDDTFIFFPCQIELIDQNDLPKFWEIYDEYKDCSNILIDSRLSLLISYAAIKYGEDLLIYDPYTTKIKTIYYYCSDYFKIQTNELTIHQIKQVFILKLLLSYFLYYLEIPWNVNNVIKNIKQMNETISSSKFSNMILIDVLINYIGIKKVSVIDKNNIKQLCNLIYENFSINAFDSKKAKRINKWKVDNLSQYEFYVTLTILKNNNFTFFISAII